jgi:hypothetical protein
LERLLLQGLLLQLLLQGLLLEGVLQHCRRLLRMQESHLCWRRSWLAAGCGGGACAPQQSWH